MKELLKYTKDKRGITFVELMITIFIVMFGIVGSLGLMQRTISGGKASALRFQATYLAQEGLELIRNVRDSNWITNKSDWLHWLSPSCHIISYNHVYGQPVATCSGNNIDLFYHNQFYSHNSSGEATPFRRELNLSNCPAPDNLISKCVEIKATVSWGDEGEKVEAIQRLYNWR